jgi:hypothetical protein
VTTFVALAGISLWLGAAGAPSPAAKGAVALRVAAVERALCLTSCPAIPADATSDWLRSDEGQKANGCQIACRTALPATTLYAEQCDLASLGTLRPDASLVKLAGKDGPALVRRLQAALKAAEGHALGPLCARAREPFGTHDETGYLECVGRTARTDARAPAPLPDPTRALRCITLLAEREADWLRRCPTLEARAEVDACAARAEELAASRHQTAPNARATCERDAIERLSSAFRNHP